MSQETKTARDVIAEMRAMRLAADPEMLRVWADRLESALAHNGKAVTPRVALELPDGDDRSAKVRFTYWDGDELCICISVEPTTPPAPLGGLTEDDVEWVVNDIAELGVKIGQQFFFCYKGGSLVYGERGGETENGVCLHDDGTPMMVRPVGKREFGETCKPIIHMKVENGHIYDRTPYPYRQELTYTPGLSFGKPGDADWRPLPAAGMPQSA